MAAGGSMGWGDLYGPTQLNTSGPVAETNENASSGAVGPAQVSPTTVWLGLIAALVLLRVAWHFSEA
jgi:hypothetical protein